MTVKPTQVDKENEAKNTSGTEAAGSDEFKTTL